MEPGVDIIYLFRVVKIHIIVESAAVVDCHCRHHQLTKTKTLHIKFSLLFFDLMKNTMALFRTVCSLYDFNYSNFNPTFVFFFLIYCLYFLINQLLLYISTIFVYWLQLSFLASSISNVLIVFFLDIDAPSELNSYYYGKCCKGIVFMNQLTLIILPYTLRHLLLILVFVVGLIHKWYSFVLCHKIIWRQNDFTYHWFLDCNFNLY